MRIRTANHNRKRRELFGRFVPISDRPAQLFRTVERVGRHHVAGESYYIVYGTDQHGNPVVERIKI